ncbi:GNAT family N-acetyltransferase [Acutalibacter caecimuris]|uniref:GNAT family N-acetyltransferase n=1 Tax=Acutalibacter caecimuris TaxID=3093657 RepID=UPI002AC94A91|nr:GNAT family N-acetyltransferase [Acutalibacter sp. M00118]
MNTGLLFSSFPFYSGHGVSLARMTDLDIPALWEVLGDEENFRYAPTAALGSIEQCARRILQADAMFRDRVAVMLGIYPDGAGDRLAGVFEIYNIDPRIESVTVRFTLARAFTGKSLATGALRASVDYLMASIGVHRLQAYVLPSNYRGVLVLERCGFVKEGTIREGFFWPDKGIVDLSLYSLLPTDLRRPGDTGVILF